MPRCGCSGSCDCLIEGGPGITVEGLGTVEQPYEISAESAMLSQSLHLVDSSTVAWTTTGQGDVGDPLVVEADATLRLTDLTDVQGAPASGQVPVWQNNHWEFMAPPVVPPGAVNVSHGIGGVGSAAQPLALATPLDFGVAEAGHQGLEHYGTDSTFGQPVYVDSNGKVRAAPIVIPVASAPTSAALGGTYPVGVSVMSLDAATATAGGWPESTAGTVLSVRRVGDADAAAIVQQWWYRGSTPRELFRQFSNGAWSAWSEPLEDTGWVDVPIASGFGPDAGGKPQVRRIGKVVYTRGGWSNTGVTKVGDFTVGTAPAGFFPASGCMIPATGTPGTSPGRFDWGASGNIRLRVTTLSSYYKWNGYSWPVD